MRIGSLPYFTANICWHKIVNTFVHHFDVPQPSMLVYVLRAIKYRIQGFMATLNCFRTRFCQTLAKNYFNKRTELEAVRALT